MPTNNCQ